MTNLKSIMESRGAQVLEMKHLKGGKGNTNGGGGMPPTPGDD